MKQDSDAIRLENVSFKYLDDDRNTLENIDISFRKESMNLILGPSGCGKTTLLYALDGLLGTSVEGTFEGNIKVMNEDAGRKNTALIFQNPDNGFCTFMVEDEIAFGLENLNTPADEIKERIEYALAKVNMSGSEKRLLTSLSGGEKQKIAIACGIATDADVYLFDEPTANLDSTSRKEISSLLCDLKSNDGKTIIIVEHNLQNILKFVDDMTLLDGSGHVVLTGNIDVVLAKLMFDSRYIDFPVFLPNTLQLLRAWIRDNFDNEKVRNFSCESMEKAGSGMLKAGEIADSIIDGLIRGGMCEPDGNEDVRSGSRGSAVIEIDDFTFCYPGMDEPLIKADHIDVCDREFAAIVGENGIGKSTFAEILVKALEGYKGKISIQGEDLKTMRKRDLYRTLGMVFQNPDWQFITNRLDDEIMFSLKATDKSDEEKQKITDDLLERFDLSEQRENSPFELSQGQKRRLSVAVMLLTDQKILILDEPTYGQDYDNKIELMKLLRSLNNKGITIIMITHEMDIVAQYADSVICVEQDRPIRKLGTKEFFDDKELLARLKQEYPDVRDFTEMMHDIFSDFQITYDYWACSKQMKMISLKGGRNV